MASSKKKKPSILRRLAVTESDDISMSDTLTADINEERTIPEEVRGTACDEAADVLSRVATFDRKTKANLHEVYEEIEDVLKSDNCFPEVKEEMSAEFGDINKVIHLKKADVYEELCPIVITGETSAGKSTFVNLLLGVELLPQSPLTCTSPICRISNRVRKRIVLIDSEDNQQIVELENTEGAEEMRRRLKGYISATQAGEKYKAVDICWPIACLQNKIMIVDTPGIGPDNDILANRLFEYLPSALAFIYVINPTNAGGVQSDRLQRILEEQEKRKCMGVKSVFDPRRAIFVCNKWDQMHEDEEQVFDHIKEKLSNKWTNFDSSKIYKVSAWEEMQRSKNGQPISDNFKALLRGIDQMIPACLQEKISRHVNWQRYFLERLNFKLTARIINAMRTEDEKRKMAKQVVKRIQKVRENIKSVQSKLKSVAKEQCQKSSELLNLYLHLPEIRNNMFSWTDDVLPEKDDIETIEKEVMRFVEECIARQIQTWLKQSNNGGLSEFMAKQFKKECAIIETDCTEIDDIILGRSLSTCELGISTPRRQSDRDTSSSTNISTAQKVAILATFPIWMPLSLVVGLFAVPIGIGYYTVGKITDKRSVKEYRQNKQVYVKNIAEKMLEEITIQFLKEKVFRQFLNEMNIQIDQFCDSTVPRRIAAGEILIKGIKKDIRQPVEIRKQCILVESDLKSAYGRVLFIDIEYFDKFKLSQSDVRRKDLSSELEVFVNGGWKDTVVKQMKWSYSNKSDCSVLSEIQILRNIKHEHILDVLGITLASEKSGHILEIYTEKCEKSLETAIYRSTKQAEPWRCIHLYLCQCLEGLTYLHEHGLIHGNVKPSNMLIKDGIARLSGGGIHRPLLKGPIHGIAVIKAPDLLRSLFYGRESDVFRFGIILWESWYRRSALNEENESSLESYEQLSYIILEGRRPNFEGKIISKLKLLIQRCWEKDPVDRPTARNILERLRNIRKDT